jgi:hypothetical protein
MGAEYNIIVRIPISLSAACSEAPLTHMVEDSEDRHTGDTTEVHILKIMEELSTFTIHQISRPNE